jgi:basic amino acid/polyamine antiporter, APA family
MSMLRRRLNVFDLTLITIGSIIGSGIFKNPALVAGKAHLPSLAIGCWIVGGLIALIGAFVFAELAERRPVNGGIYAYLRDAYHPIVAFVFGWTLLLIADTGGTAAASVLFATYLTPLTGMAIDTRIVAVVTLAVLVAINCLGVRQGGTWQNVLVILKVAAIAGLIGAGLLAHPAAGAAATLPGFDSSTALLGAFGIAMLPVLFAYNGFQGATYITGETVNPERTIPRGLIMGVVAVIAIYVLVNIGCLRVLGPAGLAATSVPAADVMSAALGPIGARLIAIAIALSTLGFMSTRMLVAPRVYFQMAADGTFFKQLAWINPKTSVPTIAIIAEGVVAAIIAASGTFAQIVNWIVAPEWIFVVLAAGAIFIFRKRDGDAVKPAFRVPLHPFSTILLMVVLLAIFVTEVILVPRDTLYGALVIVAGIAFYYLWRRVARPA